MIRIRRKILDFVSRKQVKQFMGFVVAAFIFLMLTKLSQSYSKEMYVNIDFTNVPQEQTIVNDSLKLRAVVRAIGFNMLPLEFTKKTLRLNVDEDVSESKGCYIWTSDRGQYKIEELFGSSYEVVSITPDTLIFNYERMSTKRVPVILNGDITYALGYDSLDSIKFSPDSITFVGAESALNGIHFVKTELLELTEVKSDITQKVKLDRSMLSDVLKMSEEEVSIINSIEKFTEGKIEVPVQINNIPSNISVNFFPKEVSVTYRVGLKDFKAIKASDFSIVCDFSDLEKMGTNNLVPRLVKVPKQVKNVRIKQSKIDFIIVE
ncbi:CdaR family protein [Winogradskyella sp. 3972H.M.0a.05]|uniref:CdaR family protein n=1 Tax=Winogradskyella sp. 3972H.M.0a.05 TaxID=2950277 RepID=UPI0033998C46